MNKLAIFVEGQTEQLFIEKLIQEIANEKSIEIKKKEKTFAGNWISIEANSKTKEIDYFVLIFNCSADNKVISDIRDRYEGLSSTGYQKIIAIRDTYPDATYEEASKLRNSLSRSLPKGAIPISLILGIMEIEAWFLAEYTHFVKINSNFTPERIKKDLGIDLIHDDLSKRKHPSKDLSDIYWLETMNYDKKRETVIKILSAINYKLFKEMVAYKFCDLYALYTELNTFFEEVSQYYDNLLFT